MPEPSTQPTTSAVVPEQSAPPAARASFRDKLRPFLIPLLIVLLAAGILGITTSQWNTWTGGHSRQVTDDAYVRADITPLSTKISGIVGQVAVQDYQRVKTGDLLVQINDDDFLAQVEQAEAAVFAAEAAVDRLRNSENCKRVRLLKQR